MAKPNYQLKDWSFSGSPSAKDADNAQCNITVNLKIQDDIANATIGDGCVVSWPNSSVYSDIVSTIIPEQVNDFIAQKYNS